MRSLKWNQVTVMSLGLILASAQIAASDEGRGPESKPHMRGEGSSSGDMKSRRQEMRTRMQEQQRKLDELASRMNQATGQDKVEAMAALLNEMVAQRKALRDRMADGMGKRQGGGAGEGYGSDGDGKAETPGSGRRSEP